MDACYIREQTKRPFICQLQFPLASLCNHLYFAFEYESPLKRTIKFRLSINSKKGFPIFTFVSIIYKALQSFEPIESKQQLIAMAFISPLDEFACILKCIQIKNSVTISCYCDHHKMNRKPLRRLFSCVLWQALAFCFIH